MTIANPNDPRVLILSREDYELLKDSLDAWLEGYEDAKDQIIEDMSIEELDALLVITASMDNEFSRLTAIRNTLWNLANR